MNTYPELAYCTLPEAVEGPDGIDLIVYGFEFRDGMYDLAAFHLSQGMLQGIAPVNVVMTIDKGLAWLAQFQAPTDADLAYFDSL